MPYKNPADKARWRKAYNAASRDKIREWNRAAGVRRKANLPAPTRPPAAFDAKSYQRNYYRQNARQCNEISKRRSAHRIGALRELIRERKAVPCADCGGTFPPVVMDFDHLPGHEKAFAISRIKGSSSLKRLLDEIAKCEVVCSNCHRIRTFSRRQHLRTPEKGPDAQEKPPGQMGLFGSHGGP